MPHADYGLVWSGMRNLGHLPWKGRVWSSEKMLKRRNRQSRRTINYRYNPSIRALDRTWMFLKHDYDRSPDPFRWYPAQLQRNETISSAKPLVALAEYLSPGQRSDCDPVAYTSNTSSAAVQLWPICELQSGIVSHTPHGPTVKGYISCRLSHRSQHPQAVRPAVPNSGSGASPSDNKSPAQSSKNKDNWTENELDEMLGLVLMLCWFDVRPPLLP